jgi:hypothetical protein
MIQPLASDRSPRKEYLITPINLSYVHSSMTILAMIDANENLPKLAYACEST